MSVRGIHPEIRTDEIRSGRNIPAGADFLQDNDTRLSFPQALPAAEGAFKLRFIRLPGKEPTPPHGKIGTSDDGYDAVYADLSPSSARALPRPGGGTNTAATRLRAALLADGSGNGREAENPRHESGRFRFLSVRKPIRHRFTKAAIRRRSMRRTATRRRLPSSCTGDGPQHDIRPEKGYLHGCGIAVPDALPASGATDNRSPPHYKAPHASSTTNPATAQREARLFPSGSSRASVGERSR